jgi:hypothetical protein
MRTFRPKRGAVTRGLREFHKGELHNRVSSPIIIIMVIKSRKFRWEKHAACIEEIRNV